MAASLPQVPACAKITPRVTDSLGMIDTEIALEQVQSSWDDQCRDRGHNVVFCSQ